MPQRTRADVTPEELAQKFIYDPDTGKIYLRLGDGEWSVRGKEKFNVSDGNYLSGRYGGIEFRAHRVAWAIHYGTWPSDQIDHINGDGKDNRISNMRDVSNLENCRNLGRRKISHGPDSGVNGVYWHKQSRKWMARIKKAGVWIYLGTYADLDAAISVRRQAEKAYGFHPNHGGRPSAPKHAGRGKSDSHFT